jgi:hypothetical protein
MYNDCARVTTCLSDEPNGLPLFRHLDAPFLFACSFMLSVEVAFSKSVIVTATIEYTVTCKQFSLSRKSNLKKT